MGGDDVGFETVRVIYFGCGSRARGVVFDRLYHGGHIVLISFEIYLSQLLFMTAANVAHRHSSLVVSSARFFEGSEQRLFRRGFGDVLKAQGHAMTGAGGNGI